MHPATLNSCIVPNACKKVELMKTKEKVTRSSLKTLGCLPTSAFVYSLWLDFMKLMDPQVGSLLLNIPGLLHRNALACDHSL